MKRASKILVAFGLLLFFTFGVSCAAHAAPGLALASLMDCSQNRGPMAMAGCDHPTYLCGFDSSKLFLQATSTARHYSDLSKKGRELAIREVQFGIPNQVPLISKNSEYIFLRHQSHKVSSRLLNSTLNL